MFGAQARFLRSAVRISGVGTEYVRIGDEGGKATFRFCAQCGATAYYTFEGMPDFIVIPVGAFADPAFPRPTFSVYEDRMHSWVTMEPDIEHMR